MGVTTWDPNFKGAGITLSNGNLTATTTGAYAVGANRAFSGKSYFEVLVVAAAMNISPVFTTVNGAGTNCTIKSAAADFLYTVPSGFSPWDTTTGTWGSVGGAVTLANSNTQARSGGGSAVGSTSHFGTGKYYLEFNIDAWPGGGYNGFEVGFCQTPYNYSADLTHNGTISAGFQSDGLLAYNSASLGPNIGAPVTGNRVCFAIDMGVNQIYGRTNAGNWNASGTANPSTGTGGLTIGGFAPALPFGVGICNKAGTNMPGGDANSLGFRSTGAVMGNNTTITTIQTWGTNGDIVQTAVDFYRQLIWFNANNGLWNNSSTASPSTGVGGISITATPNIGGTMYPVIGFNGSGGIMTGQFSTANFTYTPPSGFLSVDTIQSPAVNGTRYDGPSRASGVIGRGHHQISTGGGAANNGYATTTYPANPVYVSGQVQEGGSPVANRVVRVFSRQTGEFLGTAITDSSGNYRINAKSKKFVDVVASDLPGYNSIVWANVVPM